MRRMTESSLLIWEVPCRMAQNLSEYDTIFVTGITAASLRRQARDQTLDRIHAGRIRFGNAMFWIVRRATTRDSSGRGEVVLTSDDERPGLLAG